MTNPECRINRGTKGVRRYDEMRVRIECEKETAGGKTAGTESVKAECKLDCSFHFLHFGSRKGTQFSDDD